MNRLAVTLILVLLLSVAPDILSSETQTPALTPVEDDAVGILAAEVARLGWVVYSARSEQGDWDIFCCRPNGTDIRNLTRTPQSTEFSPQVSRDGRQTPLPPPAARRDDRQQSARRTRRTGDRRQRRLAPAGAGRAGRPTRGPVGVPTASRSPACPSKASPSSIWPRGRKSGVCRARASFSS